MFVLHRYTFEPILSGAYCGVAQHGVYNVLFTRVFGKGTDFVTASKKVCAISRSCPITWLVKCSPSMKALLFDAYTPYTMLKKKLVSKVLADSLWHAPMLYFPLYYR